MEIESFDICQKTYYTLKFIGNHLSCRFHVFHPRLLLLNPSDSLKVYLGCTKKRLHPTDGNEKIRFKIEADLLLVEVKIIQ